MEVINGMGELESGDLEDVTGGVQADKASSRSAVKSIIVNKHPEGIKRMTPEIMTDPGNPDDPNWAEIDYKCPKCGANIFRWICPGTQSQLLCRKCGWQKWF